MEKYTKLFLVLFTFLILTTGCQEAAEEAIDEHAKEQASKTYEEGEIKNVLKKSKYKINEELKDREAFTRAAQDYIGVPTIKVKNKEIKFKNGTTRKLQNYGSYINNPELYKDGDVYIIRAYDEDKPNEPITDLSYVVPYEKLVIRFEYINPPEELKSGTFSADMLDNAEKGIIYPCEPIGVKFGSLRDTLENHTGRILTNADQGYLGSKMYSDTNGCNYGVYFDDRTSDDHKVVSLALYEIPEDLTMTLDELIEKFPNPTEINLGELLGDYYALYDVGSYKLTFSGFGNNGFSNNISMITLYEKVE